MSNTDATPLDPDMYELFRSEVSSHVAALERDLVCLETDPGASTLEALMRAAHSIKGAARIIGLDMAVGLAHRMEDYFVALQEGRACVEAGMVDLLLRGVDFYKRLQTAGAADANDWLREQAPETARIESELSNRIAASGSRSPEPSAPNPVADVAPMSANADMIDLFKMELQTHLAVLRSVPDLVHSAPPGLVDDLARAAHSIKGAARIVGLDGAARLAGSLEALFNAVREGRVPSAVAGSDAVAQSLQFLGELEALAPEDMPAFLERHAATCLARADACLALPGTAPPAPPPVPPLPPAVDTRPTEPLPADESLPVTTETLNRLTGLAGEAWVNSRRLDKHVQRLHKLCERHREIEKMVRAHALASGQPDSGLLRELAQRMAEVSGDCAEAWREIQQFGFGTEDLTSRLYNTSIAARMRPIADGLKAFPRLVRDMARHLEKKIRFDAVGGSTRVDRDILSQLDAPLNHIVRNACDHGIESIPERLAAGKPEQGFIRIEASHRGGRLIVTVADDGRGVNLERIKEKVLQRQMAGADWVERMSQEELLEFLFLPGFSTTTSVSEYSGRGVGMDVVRTRVQRIGGTVHLRTTPGRGSVVEMQLPLSLALLRVLLVTAGPCTLALPLARLEAVRRPAPADCTLEDGCRFLVHEGTPIPLLEMADVLRMPHAPAPNAERPVILCGPAEHRKAFAVDRILDETEVVVHPLDPRLGQVPAIHAGILLADGSIALLVEPADLAQLAPPTTRPAETPLESGTDAPPSRRRRILVVDDSRTVREVERRLLEGQGGQVDLAVDGLDGWEQVRAAPYDLVISDIDMPRMNGIEFVTRIKQDPLLKEIPVIIVSYKDQEEDRIRGLKAGANFYLTKSSFQDETLIQAVRYLIGDLS